MLDFFIYIFKMLSKFMQHKNSEILEGFILLKFKYLNVSCKTKLMLFKKWKTNFKVIV